MYQELEEALKNIKLRCHSKSMKYDPIDFDLEIIEQELKTLEIIKEKYVDLVILRDVDIVEKYNKYIKLSYCRKELTQEEFDLLKRYFDER